MSRLGGAGAVAPLVTDMPLSSSIEVRLKRERDLTKREKDNKTVVMGFVIIDSGFKTLRRMNRKPCGRNGQTMGPSGKWLS